MLGAGLKFHCPSGPKLGSQQHGWATSHLAEQGSMNTADFFFNEMSPGVCLPLSLGSGVIDFGGVSQFAPWL